MTRRVVLACLMWLCAWPVGAQTLVANRVRLNPGGCLVDQTGSGSPEGVLVGIVCDHYTDTTSGQEYYKLTGSSTTGWITWTSAKTALSIMSRDASNSSALSTLDAVSGTLSLNGFPTRTTGGGFHVGTAAITDPGLGNTALDGYIGSNSFVSETIGWRCTFLGACDMRYLFADEVRVELFVAELEAVIAGSQRVVKSHSTLSKPFTCPGSSMESELWVFDSKVIQNAAILGADAGPPNDWVVIRSLVRGGAFGAGSLTITDCVGEVTGYVDGTGADDGQQMWIFTRGPSGSGGMMDSEEVVPVETLVQDLGISGNGFVETSAVDGVNSENAPYTQIVTWTSAPVSANFSVRSRCGNLKGITAVTNEYGCIFGTYAGTGGQYVKASNLGVDLQGVDLSMWDGSDIVFKVRRNSGDPYLSIGNPAPGAYGGTGIFLGSASGVAQLSLYTDASNYLLYDGSVLAWKAANTELDAAGNLTATSATLSGSITAGSGAIGGWVLGSTFFYDAAGLCGMSSAVTGGDDVRIWCGGGTIATAPVRIYESGAFHFGGTGGAIDWTGSALTVSGNGSGLTSISGGNITTGSITATQIQAATITASQIAANTITAAQIAAATITATEIAAGTITAAKLNVTTLSAITGNLGTITAGSISIGGNFAVNTSGFLTASGISVGGFNQMDQTTFVGDVLLNSGVNLQTGLRPASARYLCVQTNGVAYAGTSCP